MSDKNNTNTAMEDLKAQNARLQAQLEQLTALLASLRGAEQEKREKGRLRSAISNEELRMASEWAHEHGFTLDIDERNARLRKRGYNV